MNVIQEVLTEHLPCAKTVILYWSDCLIRWNIIEDCKELLYLYGYIYGYFSYQKLKEKNMKILLLIDAENSHNKAITW